MAEKSNSIKIGIFWVYKKRVIGKARDLEECQENVPGLIDSPDSHVDLWENDPNFDIPFPELKRSEYQDVPRGRVIYSVDDNQVVVYLDKVLRTKQTKQIISKFFQLSGAKVVWKADLHYTTESCDIDDLFER